MSNFKFLSPDSNIWVLYFMPYMYILGEILLLFVMYQICLEILDTKAVCTTIVGVKRRQQLYQNYWKTDWLNNLIAWNALFSLGEKQSLIINVERLLDECKELVSSCIFPGKHLVFVCKQLYMCCISIWNYVIWYIASLVQKQCA